MCENLQAAAKTIKNKQSCGLVVPCKNRTLNQNERDKEDIVCEWHPTAVVQILKLFEAFE